MLPHGLVVMTIGVLLSDLGNDHYSRHRLFTSWLETGASSQYSKESQQGHAKLAFRGHTHINQPFTFPIKQRKDLQLTGILHGATQLMQLEPQIRDLYVMKALSLTS